MSNRTTFDDLGTSEIILLPKADLLRSNTF